MFCIFFCSVLLFKEKGWAKGEGERISSRLHIQPDMGLDLMTRPEIKSWLLNQVSLPGAPVFVFVLFFIECVNSPGSLFQSLKKKKSQLIFPLREPWFLFE